MTRRWNLITAAPAAAAAILVGGWAVSAGKPVPNSLALCGTGSVGANELQGNSDQDHPDPSMFTAQQQPAGTTCTADNSAPGSNSWTIEHSNVDVVTERGTEHGDLSLAGTQQQAGFDGHITDFDLPNGDACMSSNRNVYYQSGKETSCPTSFGPVGNFNTHGGASTGQHFRGKYGTLIFQQNSNSHTCDVGTTMYCIQVDLDGQTN